MMATVRHVTSGSGCMKFHATWFLLNWVYNVGFGVLLMRNEVIRSITFTVNPDIIIIYSSIISTTCFGLTGHCQVEQG